MRVDALANRTMMTMTSMMMMYNDDLVGRATHFRAEPQHPTT